MQETGSRDGVDTPVALEMLRSFWGTKNLCIVL